MTRKPEQSGADGAQGEGTLLSHLFELRTRLLRMILAILVVFLALFPFANKIYTILADPLMVHLPEGSSMIAIEVAAPFLIPFKLVLLLAVVLTIPYLLYQIWGFVAPGLYRHEKRLAVPLLVSSTLLFYLGMAFAYFVVFPLIFAFFTGTAPEGVAVMTDISRYLDFVITLFIAFGLAFEVPIATILLVSMGVTTPEKLAEKRPYVIVGAFVIGMLLTPPDILSQTLLALPMWFLFEVGLILSRAMLRRRAQEAERAGQESPDDGVPEDSAGPARAATASAAAASARAEDYHPMTDEEMDAELDRLAREEKRGWQAPDDGQGSQPGRIDDDTITGNDEAGDDDARREPSGKD